MYKKDDDDNERETPPLTNTKGILTMNRFMSVMIVAILLVTFSAIMVQTQETRQSPGMSGSSMMRVQRSAPLMPKSMIANEE
jgi:flagellar biogenesis protein FliO